jgi:hypothetical protein
VTISQQRCLQSRKAASVPSAWSSDAAVAGARPCAAVVKSILFGKCTNTDIKVIMYSPRSHCINVLKIGWR